MPYPAQISLSPQVLRSSLSLKVFPHTFQHPLCRSNLPFCFSPSVIVPPQVVLLVPPRTDFLRARVFLHSSLGLSFFSDEGNRILGFSPLPESFFCIPFLSPFSRCPSRAPLSEDPLSSRCFLHKFFFRKICPFKRSSLFYPAFITVFFSSPPFGPPPTDQDLELPGPDSFDVFPPTPFDSPERHLS